MSLVRLYLDEDVNPLLADHLRVRGFDVVSTEELGWRGRTDEDQLRLAAGEGRCLLTHNRDDFLALATKWAQAGIPQATRISGDGGIDGYGKLRLGLASMNVAFQCKRWKENVGRREVDEFRGAIQGEYEQGVLFATSDFAPQAREASLKKGAVPIILLNGEGIVNLMIEKGLGVSRTPLYILEERPDELVGEGEQ